VGHITEENSILKKIQRIKEVLEGKRSYKQEKKENLTVV